MKKLISLILCLLIILSAPVVQAAGLNSIITAQEIQDSSLLLYSTVLPENGSLKVTVKNQQVSDAELTTVRSEKLPVTVYCLVDLSTHMSSRQVQQQKDALNIINSRMGENDSMVITTVGRTISEGVVLDTYEARKAAIDTLKHDVYNVDMYQAIVDAVTSLKTKTTYNVNRCLLILSDGAYYTTSKSTQQDAANAVSKSNVPTYVLATTGDYSDRNVTKTAQNVLKMADLPTAGMGIIPANESITAAQATEKIWENIQSCNVIKIDLNNVETRENATTVHVSYEVNSARYEGTTVVDLADVSIPSADTDELEVIELPSEPEPIPEPVPEPVEETLLDQIKKNAALIGIIAAVAVALIAVLIVVTRKPKPVPEPANNKNQPKDPNLIFEEDIPKGQGFKTENDYPNTTAAKELKLQFSVTTHKNVKIDFKLVPHTVQILGRDDRADIIVNAEDNQLSGRHCNVEWDGNHVYIQDIGSTNGTYINSVRLKTNAWNRLENGAVITMGSFDYLVTITE